MRNKKILSKILAVIGIMTVLISAMIVPSAAWTVKNDGNIQTNSVIFDLEILEESEEYEIGGNTVVDVTYTTASDITLRYLMGTESRTSCLVFTFSDKPTTYYGHIMTSRLGYTYSIKGQNSNAAADYSRFDLNVPTSSTGYVGFTYTRRYNLAEYDAIPQTVNVRCEVFPSYAQYRSALQALVADGTITAADAQKEIDSLNAQISTLSTQMSDLRYENGLLESEISDLEAENYQLQIDVEDYYQAWNNAEDMVSELEEEKAAMTTELEQLRADAGEYPELVASLRKQILEMENANVIDELFTGIFGAIWEGLYTVWNLGYTVGDTYVSIGGILIVIVVGVVAFFVIKLLRGGS